MGGYEVSHFAPLQVIMHCYINYCIFKNIISPSFSEVILLKTSATFTNKLNLFKYHLLPKTLNEQQGRLVFEFYRHLQALKYVPKEKDDPSQDI